MPKQQIGWEEKEDCAECEPEKWEHKKPGQTVPICSKCAEKYYEKSTASLPEEKPKWGGDAFGVLNEAVMDYRAFKEGKITEQERVQKHWLRAKNLNNLISQAISIATQKERERLIKEVERLKDFKITRVGGIFNGDIPIHIRDEEKESLVKQTLDRVLSVINPNNL